MAWLFSARTDTTGSLALYCGVETASRERARMKTSLKRGWAVHSSAITKRVPICAPAAPISTRCAIILPVAMPPATKIGTRREVEEDLLQQHDGRDVADVAAGLAALEDQRVGAVVDHALGDAAGRGEAQHLGAAVLGLLHLRGARDRAGEDDVADLALAEDVQVRQVVRRDGDHVAGEGP